MPRTIFHVDMDAFYASVEQRDEPRFRGKPVIVGADPKDGRGRGVVAACSYEARRFGVHSAMPISQAFRACPQGVYLRPDMTKYVAVSRLIREIFGRFTPRVEPMSIDEAYLDMSHSIADAPGAMREAARLKRAVYQEQRLTASVGIAPNKMLAKIASDWRKPNGLFLVRPEEVEDFLAPLPPKKIPGIGPRTAERLADLGVRTIGELRGLKKEELQDRLGKFGLYVWGAARGRDERPVVTDHETKSVSQETTYSEDVLDHQVLIDTIRRQSERVASRLERSRLKGRTVVLKLRYSDFTTFTRQVSSRFASREASSIRNAALLLLDQHRDRNRRVRLVGVGVANLETDDTEAGTQLHLPVFEE